MDNLLIKYYLDQNNDKIKQLIASNKLSKSDKSLAKFLTTHSYSNFYNLLFFGCQNGLINYITFLLKHVPDFDVTINDNSLIKVCCEKGFYDIVKFLKFSKKAVKKVVK